MENLVVYVKKVEGDMYEFVNSRVRCYICFRLYNIYNRYNCICLVCCLEMGIFVSRVDLLF